MSAQIKFFKKNKADISNSLVSITVTDATATNNGQDFVDFMRNRNNYSAWLTTGSNDAANTTLVVDMTEERDVDTIILVDHNFDSYTLKYWNGSSYVDFSTAISVSGNTSDTTSHDVTSVSTSRIQLVITGTQVADADKRLAQLIVTEKLVSGQLEGWPIIKAPEHTTNKKISRMLSGKVNVVESLGAFSMDLEVANWNIDADLDIVEEIYFGKRGVLVWLSAGNEAQFSHLRMGS